MKEDAGKHTEVSHWRDAWEKRPSPSQQEEGCASGCAQLRAGDSGMHRSPPQLTNTVHEEKAQEAPKTRQKGGTSGRNDALRSAGFRGAWQRKTGFKVKY